jgi:hypothetical protein
MMDAKLFAELLESVTQMGEIARGERAPACCGPTAERVQVMPQACRANPRLSVSQTPKFLYESASGVVASGAWTGAPVLVVNACCKRSIRRAFRTI